MRARQGGRRLASFAAGGAIGVAAVLAGEIAGGVAGLCLALVIIFGAIAALTLLRVPGRVRALWSQLLDCAEGPPPDAALTDLPLAQRWVQALSAARRSELDALMGEAFEYAVPAVGATVSRKQYLSRMRFNRVAFMSSTFELDEVRVSPGAPDEFWVAMTQRARAYTGTVFDTTWWELWRLDAAHEHVLCATVITATRVG